MAYNPEVEVRLNAITERRSGYSKKKMFGGVAFMLNGNMCIGINGDDLMLRCGPEKAEAAIRNRGAQPMNFTGRTMKGWLTVPGELAADDDELEGWVDYAEEFVATLPKK